MMLDTIFALNQYISNLQEPMKFFVFMGIYAGLPILCILLLLLDKELEERKERKIFEERIKKCQNL